MEHRDGHHGHGEDATVRLARRAMAGDQAAVTELWRQHRRWVAAVILAHRPHSVEVDDLMQDVAVKVVTRIDTLRDPEAFLPWLRQVVLNICRGAARKHRPMLRLVSDSDREDRQATSTAAEAPPSTEVSAEDSAEQSDTARRLMAQVLSLPPEYREPLLLRCMHSMTYQQISEILELPVTTIETRLARARRMLRAELDWLASDFEPKTNQDESTTPAAAKDHAHDE